MAEEAKKKEETVKVRLQVKAIPVRDYLEDNVVPLLLQGLQHLIVERPPNPVGYLGEFLVRSDPLRPPEAEKKEPDCAHCAHSPPPPPPPPAPVEAKAEAPAPPAEGEAAPAEEAPPE